MDHALLRKWNPMAGVDPHNEITLALVPAPFIPHVVGMVLCGDSNSSRLTTNVTASDWAIVQRDSDIGAGIPHVPLVLPACVLFGALLLLSGSKSYFGPSSVRANGKPVAAAVLLHYFNVNLNCADPIYMPNNLVVAWGTVVCGMTWGDIIGGLAAMLIDIILSGAYTLLGAGVSSAAGGKLAKFLVSALASVIAQQLAGSPVGFSVAPGRDENSNWNPANWGPKLGHGLGDLISNAPKTTSNDPATEQH